ncbi:hypothetical protein LRS73_25850 [Methylobacterium currus]|uniref:beta strand repeat-containing protein n=1 Tax=Methylobacterium currus TaxID=2051553 RepID=UPI001E56D6EC|nr:hypothetical protein [Methylobacterium currus]UHC15871.1 hypothetical protein LRS73_25850 [Methylobacterium currus]
MNDLLQARGRLRQACLASCSMLLLMTIGCGDPAQAAVEYVKICSSFGAHFFYVPGTDTCAYGANLPVIANTLQGPISTQPGTGAAGYGFSSFSNGLNSVAIGDHAFSGGDPFSASPGTLNGLASIDGSAPVSAFSNSNTTAVGQGSRAGAGAAGQDNATAIGQGATANGANATALGQGATATGAGGVALGQGSVADQANTVSVGAVGAERRIVNVAPGTIGAGSTDAVNGQQLFTVSQQAANGVNALGTATAAAIGGGATYNAATNSISGLNYGLNGSQAAYTDALSGLQAMASGAAGPIQYATPGTPGNALNLVGVGGAVSLGNVAAGALTATSTDAVNGAQLFATNQIAANAGYAVATALGGGASYASATGTLTGPTYTFGNGAQFTSVGGALGNLDTRTTANTSGLAALQAGQSGLVQQAAPDTAVTVGAATGGTMVNMAGTAGNRQVTGVAAGALTATSADAVNGAQLFATNQTVANAGNAVATALGGGASYASATGTLTGPTYTFGNGAQFTSVGGALGNLDTRTTANTSGLAALQAGQSGLVQQAAPDTAVTVGAATGGTMVNMAGTAGNRQVTGVAAGALTATSADAVNGAQLFATNQIAANAGYAVARAATALGGGASYASATGTLTGPTYTFGNGAQFTSVGGALGNLDTRTTANTSGLAALQAGQSGLVQQAAPDTAVTVGAATGGTMVNMAGTAGNRQVTGVAAGALTATSTDAVNGAQLFATNQTVANAGNAVATALGGGASYASATGTLTGPTYTFGNGAQFTSVGGALGNLDTRTTANTSGLAALQAGQSGLVQQAAPDTAVTVGAATGGTMVNMAGTAGNRQVTGVAAGALTATSADAVNGAQLFATNQTVANAGNAVATALGGGASYASATGTLTGPTYTFGNGAQFTSVGGALGNLDTRTTANTSGLAALQAGQSGLVQQAAPDTAVTVGAATGGTMVNMAGTAGNRQVTGVAAGALTATSADAVNGAQLFATNTQLAANTSALGVLQGQTTTNTANIAALQNGTSGVFVATHPGDAAAPSVSGNGALAGGFAAVARGEATVAIGTGARATQSGATAIGTNAVASGDPTTAVGFSAQATGNEASAFGGLAVATGDNATALGRSAHAGGANAVAVGAFSSAMQADSVAIGQGVATTRANQIAIGSATQTYTLAGLASAQSLAAQTGATAFVTTDASGNLAASSIGPNTISALDGRVSGLEAGLGSLSRYAVESRKEARRGIASAMALASASLPSAPGRLSYVLNGATFRGEYAVGGSVAYRLDTNRPVAVTLGVAGGAGNVGARIGIMGEL